MTLRSHSWAYIQRKTVQMDTCIPVFVVALFTIAKTWKQHKCPSTEKWIQKTLYMYTTEYYSTIKKNEMMPFTASNMNGPRNCYLSELRQRKSNIIWHPLYTDSKKKWYKWTYLQNKNRLTDLGKKKTAYGYRVKGERNS